MGTITPHGILLLLSGDVLLTGETSGCDFPKSVRDPAITRAQAPMYSCCASAAKRDDRLLLSRLAEVFFSDAYRSGAHNDESTFKPRVMFVHQPLNRSRQCRASRGREADENDSR